MATVLPMLPMCPGCGHSVAHLVGGADRGTCTVVVPYPDGDPRGLAGYCQHRCGREPEIRAQFGLPPWDPDRRH